MRSLRVTTWNVLHRVHAVNWKEAPVTAFPIEAMRVAGITAHIGNWLEDGVSVVCLQEASGDQLASVRRVLGERARVFEHTYPRLPKIRGPEAAELEDAREHLVVIVANRIPARLARSKTFATDPGKGYLAIDLGDGVSVIATHVSARERGRAQMEELAVVANEVRGDVSAKAIVLGDFNAPVDVVRDVFSGCMLSDATGQLPTRIATADRLGRTIDHVIVVGGTIASGKVLDGELLSDHNPVTATVTFG